MIAADVGGTNCRVAIAQAPLEHTHELCKFQGSSLFVALSFLSFLSLSLFFLPVDFADRPTTVSDVRDMVACFEAIGAELASVTFGVTAAAAAICVAGPGLSHILQRLLRLVYSFAAR